MINSKHTPGSWKFVPHAQGDLSKILNLSHGNGVFAFGNERGELVGITLSSSAQSAANAALIAAAPEMLTALKEVFSRALEGDSLAVNSEFMRKVCRLIAKAEGRDNG